MKCQRCLSGQQAAYRVYTDALNMEVCATCAEEALGMGIAVEVLSRGKGKGNVENSEFGFWDPRPVRLTDCH